jgi:hypothetical protein
MEIFKRKLSEKETAQISLKLSMKKERSPIHLVT